MNSSPEARSFELSKSQAAECIDFRLRNGNRLAFPYSYLLKAALNGAGELIITFSTDQVTVHGRNFDRVYPALLEKRLLFLQEQDELSPNDEKDVAVRSIVFEPRS